MDALIRDAHGVQAARRRRRSRAAVAVRDAFVARQKQTLPFDRYDRRPRTADCQRSTLL